MFSCKYSGHLNPENVNSLSPKEFQAIVISKLTNKTNQKWRVRIWDHNTYWTDSGGRLHNYSNNLGQRATLVVFCAGVTDGSWLPSEEVVTPFTLRQADIIGHQRLHTTSGPADYVHRMLLKLNFILLCCVQLLCIYALPFSIVYLT